jgi:uncharacterized integral membrane protein (TIGR00697 family)
VLTEVYGYHQARRVIWLGFLCNLIVVAAIEAARVLPAAPFWESQQAFERILGYTPRVLVASFLAYLVGEFANAFVLAKMKIATGGRWLWTRTIGSTTVGQALDSAVFIALAFAGTIPSAVLASAIVTQWLVKSAVPKMSCARLISARIGAVCSTVKPACSTASQRSCKPALVAANARLASSAPLRRSR